MAIRGVDVICGHIGVACDMDDNYGNEDYDDDTDDDVGDDDGVGEDDGDVSVSGSIDLDDDDDEDVGDGADCGKVVLMKALMMVMVSEIM